MAAPNKGKTPAKKPAGGGGPAKKKGKPASSRYEISGNSIKRKNKSCPKCGAGTTLANHKDRRTCGKCGYMERN
ncbi:30S ribosomal protein S27ae [Candidatus Woesearchaeota archaeon]|nr:30S ribosomal protein S27ae [Candidatus Woesearchaeota archaeon]